jgi:hypothetical protein
MFYPDTTIEFILNAQPLDILVESCGDLSFSYDSATMKWNFGSKNNHRCLMYMCVFFFEAFASVL